MIGPQNDVLLAPEIPMSPITEYNFVARCYNNDANRIGDLYMDEMPESRYYGKIYHILKKKAFIILFYVLLLILPGINLALYTMLIVMYFRYLDAWKVYLTNFKI